MRKRRPKKKKKKKKTASTRRRRRRKRNTRILPIEIAEDDEAETEEAAAAHTHNTNTLTVTGSCGSVATTAPRHPGTTASYRHEKKGRKKGRHVVLFSPPNPVDCATSGRASESRAIDRRSWYQCYIHLVLLGCPASGMRTS